MRALVKELKKGCEAGKANGYPICAQLLAVADNFVRKSVWVLGGDGWAYDIGYGGLDHVLASGKNVKILVMDTEIYSNTGGQASKSTPTGAIAKFAAAGKVQAKKNFGLMQTQHKNVYIAYVPMDANPAATVKAFNEAENYNGSAQTGAAAIPPPLLSSPSHGSLKRLDLLGKKVGPFDVKGWTF